MQFCPQGGVEPNHVKKNPSSRSCTLEYLKLRCIVIIFEPACNYLHKVLGTYVLEMRTPGHILQILKCGERLIEAADKTQRVEFFF